MESKRYLQMLFLSFALWGFLASNCSYADSQCLANAATNYREAVNSCGNPAPSYCIAQARADYERAVRACGPQTPGGGGGGNQICVSGQRCSDYNAYERKCNLWEDYTICGYGCQTKRVCRDYDAYNRTCHLWEVEASCR